MKYIILLIALLPITGCTKEKITLYKAYLKNTTSHKIVIRPYFSGVVLPDKVITLLANNNNTFEIANGFVRGIVKYGFSSGYFGGSNDSVIVVFDDIYSITHYFNTPASLNPKYYLATSHRNIGNPESYKIVSTDLSKYQRENVHTYEFTEQDYLDAK